MPVPLGYATATFTEPGIPDVPTGEVRFTLVLARGDAGAVPPSFVTRRRYDVRLVDGKLPVTALPLGRYEVAFALVGSALPRFFVDVLASHTEAAPLDLRLAAPRELTPHETFVVNELVHREALEAAESAAGSADAANAARTDASAYQASAWAARNEASDERIRAVAAADRADTASASAVSARDGAAASASTANAAKASAETAAVTATGASASAVTARNGAEGAKNQAETASSAAATARDEAVDANTAAQAAKTTASAASATAVSSRDAAAASATSASSSADTATTAKTAATTARTGAETAATSATASATSASTSATAAAASETAAKTAETNAKASETSAKTADTAAKASATAAKTSETNSKTSETNAATSATAAQTARTAAETARDAAQASTFGGTAPAANTSLDTLTTAGEYRITWGATVAQGAPFENFYGTVQVWARAGGAVTQVAQKHNALSADASQMWQRTQTGAGWGVWFAYSAALWEADGTRGRTLKMWDPINGRWNLIYGDTGTRDITALVTWPSGVSITSGSRVLMRRVLWDVTVWIEEGLEASGPVASAAMVMLPAGFVPNAQGDTSPIYMRNNLSQVGMVQTLITGQMSIAFSGSTGAGANTRFRHTFKTSNTWPSTLPGSAFGTIPVA
jgi:hypothetical protein